MAATLQVDPLETIRGHGDGIHAGAHWLYFPSLIKSCDLDADGYESEYSPPGFLKRMFAGGQVTYHKIPSLMDLCERTTLAPQITLKDGKSGQLCFVTITHEIRNREKEMLITDVQNFVYRNNNLTLPDLSSNPRTNFENLLKRAPLNLDELTLFRFSSITWNSHRIHYDKDYAKFEGYPAPLVHGPLSATILLDLAQVGGKKISSFKYQAVRPLFCNTKVHFLGDNTKANSQADFWVEDASDQNIKYMTAQVVYSE